jgi:hypothetical protein
LLQAVAENLSLPMQKPMRNKLKGHGFGKSAPKIKGKQYFVINQSKKNNNNCTTMITFQKGK